MIMIGTAFLLLIALLPRDNRNEGENSTSNSAGDTTPSEPADQGLGGFASPRAAVENRSADDHLMVALLGDEATTLNSEAKQVLSGAVLNLLTSEEILKGFYPDGPGRSSQAAVFRASGRELFENDYHYAARVCPHLDTKGASMAYSNAFHGLDGAAVVQALSRVRVPPTAVWIHIEPPR